MLEKIEVEVVELQRWVCKKFDDESDVKLEFLKELDLERSLCMVERNAIEPEEWE